MIRRAVLRMVGVGQIHSRDDVIRYLIKEGGFDILSVTDTSVTLCVPDEPEETLTLTGWVFSSSFRLADCVYDNTCPVMHD
ncbi:MULTISPECIES: hypothetical protein [Enterobacteriaceae]|nr:MULTISPECIES: hypothetical protein [Enterobacteriaceae]MDH0965348.1 hypothetical protein [Klebsiella michiganensis]